MEEGPHLDLLRDAIAVEASAQRMLIAGDPDAAAAFGDAAARYRESWEIAPPRSFGRLIGMLKAQILAGDAQDAAHYVRAQILDADSPPASYALAVAALVLDDDGAAARLTDGMRPGADSFGRAADGIQALADRDRDAYRDVIAAIMADFAAREQHLTGVPIADTALMLDRLAEPRGMAVAPPVQLAP